MRAKSSKSSFGAQSGYSIGIRTMGICGNLILLDKSVAPNTFLDYSATPTKCSIDLGRAESLLGISRNAVFQAESSIVSYLKFR